MKQYSGEEIRRIMTEMPADLVEALRTAHPAEKITEHEARWWGYLQFARTDDYAGDSFTIKVNGGGEEVTSTFLVYTLSVRAADQRAGLVRRPWPDGGYEPCGAT